MGKLQPGQMLGPYRIIGQIGQGGMAAVYKAYQPSMDRNVAVKILPGELAESKEFAGRFQQEARIIARLEHPHILPVFDYGESEGFSYLIMRYLEAGTLKDRLAASPLSMDEIDRTLEQFADALGYAHSRGVVHRDLKPANALVDSQGNLFLTDFGIAKLLEGTSHFTKTDAVMGTPAYISPEQAQGQPVDARSDIYSLGIILYEMVTGRVPFEADTPLAVLFKHVSDPLPLPSAIRPDLPEPIEQVILKALAKDPADRFASTLEFAAAWERARTVGAGLRPAPPPPQAAATMARGMGSGTGATPVGGPSRAAVTGSAATSSLRQAQGAASPSAGMAEPAVGRAKRSSAVPWVVGCLGVLCLLLVGGGVAIALGANWRNFAFLNPGPAQTAVAGGTVAPVDGDATAERFSVAIGDEISNGVPAPGAGLIEAPGATDLYVFSAAPGQIIYVHTIEQPETTDIIAFYMTDDLGLDIFYGCLQCGDPGVISLDRGGEYTITVGNDDPDGAGYGAYRIKLWEVAPPDEFSIELDAIISRDNPGTGAGYIENPGSADAYSFTAESGQAAYFQVLQPPQTSDIINWSAFEATGNAIFNTCLACGDPGLITLERGGTYTIYVGNQTGAATGTYSFKVWSVPPPDEFTIDIGDAIARDRPGIGAGFIEAPGAKDVYTFTAAAGQSVAFRVTDLPATDDLIYWHLEDAFGNVFFETCLACGDPEPVTLASGGAYRIVVGSDTSPGLGTYAFETSVP